MSDQSRLVKTAWTLAKEVLIVGVAAALAILGVDGVNRLRTQAAARSSARTEQPDVRLPIASVGAQISLRSVNFATSPLSFVLVSSPICRYCLASKAFHGHLASEAARLGVPFYVALPDRIESDLYLGSTGFRRDAVRKWSDLSVSVVGTPTLIAVDSKGIVRRMWVGRLSAEAEGEVMSVVQNPSKADVASASALNSDLSDKRSIAMLKERLGVHGAVNIIDVRERSAPPTRKGETRIPLAELSLRAPFELDKTRVQVEDCSNLRLGECQAGLATLSNLGFQVATIGDGALYQTCAMQVAKAVE